MIACVASVSNRVIARKLEQEFHSPFIPPFCSCPYFLYELARNSRYAGYDDDGSHYLIVVDLDLDYIELAALSSLRHFYRAAQASFYLPLNSCHTNPNRDSIMAFTCKNCLVQEYLSDRFIKRSFVLTRRTRNSQLLNIPLFRSATGRRPYRIVSLWNALPQNIKLSQSFTQFKTMMTKRLLINFN